MKNIDFDLLKHKIEEYKQEFEIKCDELLELLKSDADLTMEMLNQTEKLLDLEPKEVVAIFFPEDE